MNVTERSLRHRRAHRHDSDYRLIGHPFRCRYLGLAGNALSGALISLPPALLELHLEANGFTGPIPSVIFTLNKLT